MTLDAVAMLTASATGLGALALAVHRIMRKVDEVVDDWRGAPARPGVPPRPGVMERLERIEANQHRADERLDTIEHRSAQLVNNGGSSMKDAIDRLAAAAGTKTAAPPGSGTDS